jgi:hypothetical protein
MKNSSGVSIHKTRCEASGGSVIDLQLIPLSARDESSTEGGRLQIFAPVRGPIAFGELSKVHHFVSTSEV